MNNRFLPTIAITAAAAFFATASHAQAPVKMAGGMMVNAAGMTLYTFDNDKANSDKSTCNGPCAALWPPVMATATDQASGAYSIVKRDDGTQQWAHKGKPVYTYQADQKAGDRSGDKFKDVWHIIKE